MANFEVDKKVVSTREAARLGAEELSTPENRPKKNSESALGDDIPERERSPADRLKDSFDRLGEHLRNSSILSEAREFLHVQDQRLERALVSLKESGHEIILEEKREEAGHPLMFNSKDDELRHLPDHKTRAIIATELSSEALRGLRSGVLLPERESSTYTDLEPVEALLLLRAESSLQELGLPIDWSGGQGSDLSGLIDSQMRGEVSLGEPQSGKAFRELTRIKVELDALNREAQALGLPPYEIKELDSILSEIEGRIEGYEKAGRETAELFGGPGGELLVERYTLPLSGKLEVVENLHHIVELVDFKNLGVRPGVLNLDPEVVGALNINPEEFGSLQRELISQLPLSSGGRNVLLESVNPLHDIEHRLASALRLPGAERKDALLELIGSTYRGVIKGAERVRHAAEAESGVVARGGELVDALINPVSAVQHKLGEIHGEAHSISERERKWSKPTEEKEKYIDGLLEMASNEVISGRHREGVMLLTEAISMAREIEALGGRYEYIASERVQSSVTTVGLLGLGLGGSSLIRSAGNRLGSGGWSAPMRGPGPSSSGTGTALQRGQLSGSEFNEVFFPKGRSPGLPTGPRIEAPAYRPRATPLGKGGDGGSYGGGYGGSSGSGGGPSSYFGGGGSATLEAPVLSRARMGLSPSMYSAEPMPVGGLAVRLGVGGEGSGSALTRTQSLSVGTEVLGQASATTGVMRAEPLMGTLILPKVEGETGLEEITLPIKEALNDSERKVEEFPLERTGSEIIPERKISEEEVSGMRVEVRPGIDFSDREAERELEKILEPLKRELESDLDLLEGEREEILSEVRELMRQGVRGKDLERSLEDIGVSERVLKDLLSYHEEQRSGKEHQVYEARGSSSENQNKPVSEPIISPELQEEDLFNRATLTTVINTTEFTKFLKEQGFEDLDVQVDEVSSGEINLVYKIKIGEKVFALRLNREKNPDLRESFKIEDEVRVLEALNGYPGFNALLSSSEDYALFKYIPGGNIPRQNISSSENLGKITKHLQTLHSQNVSLSNQTTLEELKRILNDLVESGNRHNELEVEFENAIEEYEGLSENVRGLSVVAHRDISPKNIMMGDDGPIIIDLERVGRDSPFVDLAAIMRSSDQSSSFDFQHRLLQSYFGEYSPDHRKALLVHERIELLRRAFIALKKGEGDVVNLALNRIREKANHQDAYPEFDSRKESLSDYLKNLPVATETIGYALAACRNNPGKEFAEWLSQSGTLDISSDDNKDIMTALYGSLQTHFADQGLDSKQSIINATRVLNEIQELVDNEKEKLVALRYVNDLLESQFSAVFESEKFSSTQEQLNKSLEVLYNFGEFGKVKDKISLYSEQDILNAARGVSFIAEEIIKPNTPFHSSFGGLLCLYSHLAKRSLKINISEDARKSFEAIGAEIRENIFPLIIDFQNFKSLESLNNIKELLRYDRKITARWLDSLIAYAEKQSRGEASEELTSFLFNVYEVFFSSTDMPTSLLGTPHSLDLCSRANRIPEVQKTIGSILVGDLVYRMSLLSKESVSLCVEMLAGKPVQEQLDIIHQLQTIAAQAIGEGHHAAKCVDNVREILTDPKLTGSSPFMKYLLLHVSDRIKKEFKTPSLGFARTFGNPSESRIAEQMAPKHIEESRFLASQLRAVEPELSTPSVLRIASDAVAFFDHSALPKSIAEVDFSSLSEPSQFDLPKLRSLAVRTRELCENANDEPANMMRDFVRLFDYYIEFAEKEISVSGISTPIEFFLHDKVKSFSSSEWRNFIECHDHISNYQHQLDLDQRKKMHEFETACETASQNFLSSIDAIVDKILETGSYKSALLDDYIKAGNGDNEDYQFILAERLAIEIEKDASEDNDQILELQVGNMPDTALTSAGNAFVVLRKAHEDARNRLWGEQFSTDQDLYELQLNALGARQKLNEFTPRIASVLTELQEYVQSVLEREDGNSQSVNNRKIEDIVHDPLICPYDVDPETLNLVLRSILSPGMRGYIESDLGISFNEFTLRELVHFAREIISRDSEKFDNLREVLTTYKGDRAALLRSFYGVAEDLSVGSTILKIAQDIDHRIAGRLFEKYNEILNQTAEAERVMSEMYGKSPNANEIRSVSKKIINRANDILNTYYERLKNAVDDPIVIDEVLQELQEVHGSLVLQIASFRLVRSNPNMAGNKSLEIVPEMKLLESVDGSDIPRFYLGQMRRMAGANARLYPNQSAQKASYDKFKESLNDKDCKFHVVVSGLEVLYFLQRRDEGTHYNIGSINGRGELQTMGVGKEFLEAYFNQLVKDKPIILDCWEKLPAKGLYESLGFKQVDVIENYHGTSLRMIRYKKEYQEGDSQ